MTISVEKFGQFEDQDVVKYVIENENQSRLAILNYGGILQEYSVIDGDKRVNLVLSGNDMDGFTKNSFYINRIIGRTAGRIGHGTWEQDGNTIQVPANENDNTLHGGPEGISQHFFDVTTDEVENKVTLTYTAKESIDGFPGDIKVVVTYQLADDDSVSVELAGTQSGKNGYFNPTIHTYFNVADPEIGDIETQLLHVDATQHLELDTEKIPTGTFIDNEGSFDLKDKKSGKAIFDGRAGGLDDVFVVNPAQIEPIATISDEKTGRSVDVYSNRNAIVVYTSAAFDESMSGLNRTAAIALEAQSLSEAPNHVAFDNNDFIQVGETKSYSIKYAYRK